MFDRLMKQSPLAWSSVASLAAMLALNIFALNQQLHEAPRFAGPAMVIEGSLA